MSGKAPGSPLIPCKNPHRFFGVDFLAKLFNGSEPSRQWFSSPQDLDPIFRPEAITPRFDMLPAFEKELLRHKPGSIIAITQNPDPYHPLANPGGFMRQVLTMIRDHGHGLVCESGSDGLLSDLDILKDIQQKSRLMVLVPLGFSQDMPAQKLNCCDMTFSQKLRLIHRCSLEEIPVGVLIKPIIPFINDTEDNLSILIQKAKEVGALFAYPSFGLYLGEEQRLSFYQWIDQEFPGLKNIYWDHFGLRKSWVSPKVKALKKSFVFTCKKAKIAFAMSDIVKLVRPNQPVQLKLF